MYGPEADSQFTESASGMVGSYNFYLKDQIESEGKLFYY